VRRVYPKGFAAETDQFQCADVRPRASNVIFSAVGRAFAPHGESISEPDELAEAVDRCLAALDDGKAAVHACSRHARSRTRTATPKGDSMKGSKPIRLDGRFSWIPGACANSNPSGPRQEDPQDIPANIHIIVGFAAGGGNTSSRASSGQKLSKTLVSP